MINYLYRLYRRVIKKKEVNIISYPKSGRTWTSFMIGMYFIKKYELNLNEHKIIHDLKSVSKKINKLPIIHIHHDGMVHNQTPQELDTDKSKYKNSKVIFLVRDPRDVVVSMYFEKNKRIPARAFESVHELPFFGEIHDFLYSERGSLDTIIEFMNIWYKSRLAVKSFKLIKYEDLRKDTFKELKSVLEFIGERNVDEAILSETIKIGSFENMRELEKTGTMAGYGLKPGNKDDIESYKTRKGKVGGYRDYFNEEEINYLNERIKLKLNSAYNY